MPAPEIAIRAFMPYFLRMKGRQFVRKLRKSGAVIETKRGKGGHVRATCKGRSSVIPMHGDTDLAPEFLRRICKQLGLDWRRVL
jgi:predicted RNA binding protein YcfA (HicA-like mRNA interferase family)